MGDLEARRDFIDVRDVARAMITLAQSGRAGLVYNVGTGQSRRVGDGLDRLIDLSGRTVRVSVDPALKSRPRAGGFAGQYRPDRRPDWLAAVDLVGTEPRRSLERGPRSQAAAADRRWRGGVNAVHGRRQ